MIEGVRAWDLEGEEISDRIVKVQIGLDDARAEVMMLDKGRTLWDEKAQRLATFIVLLSRVEVKHWTEPKPWHRTK